MPRNIKKYFIAKKKKKLNYSWCEPCKRIAPILEEKVDKAQGKWKLVKIDIDKHPKIATALKVIFLIKKI